MERKWFILAAVACGTFMATLDSSIVNVALPSITQWFHTGLAHSRWVVIAYLFCVTALLLFFGKLADTIGRKFIYNFGYIVFTLGSILCGLSYSIDQLIVSRVIQGFGASMLMANGPALITAAFPANNRGRALGILAMVVSAGLAIGPTLGGVIIKFFGWPSIFFVNVPFGILGSYLVFKYIPREFSHHVSDSFHRERNLPFFVRLQNIINNLRYFDWLGTILWIFIQTGFSLALDKENVLGLAGPLQKIISAGSVGLFILFLIWELSIEDPVLDLSLFRVTAFLNANISALLSIIGLSSITLLMPFYLQNVRGFPPVNVGLIMTAIPISIFIFAPIAGRLSDTYGPRLLSTCGISIISFSLILLGMDWYGLSVNQSIEAIVFHLTIAGVGFGLFQAPNNNAIMSAVSKTHWGIASALLATVRNFGLAIGAALSSMLLMHYYARAAAMHLGTSADSFVLALKQTFFIIGCLCALGIITSSFISKKTHDTL